MLVPKSELREQPMSREIPGKIVSFSVSSADAAGSSSASPSPVVSSSDAPASNVPAPTIMSEAVERPETLLGRTYKISKSPASEHALYVTINDIVLNAGTPHEVRRPFEIFINSKNMSQFQWIVAMTRILSAVFRKGGDVTFIVEEMKAVFDPHGGYFRPGGFVPSLVAEIGQVVEQHLKEIGMMEAPVMDEATRQLIADKKAQLAEKTAPVAVTSAVVAAAPSSDSPVSSSDNGFPPSATMCSKCNQKSLVILDGCATCLNCGHSKCG